MVTNSSKVFQYLKSLPENERILVYVLVTNYEVVRALASIEGVALRVNEFIAAAMCNTLTRNILESVTGFTVEELTDAIVKYQP